MSTSCATISGAVGPPTAASSVNHSPSRANGTYPAMRRRFASGTRSDSTGAPTPAAAGAPVAEATTAATSGTTGSVSAGAGARVGDAEAAIGSGATDRAGAAAGIDPAAGAGAPPSHSASRANGTYPAMRRRADRGVRPDVGAVGATGTAAAAEAGAAVVVSCAGAGAGSVSAGAPFRGT